jgi:hypothetical protein
LFFGLLAWFSVHATPAMNVYTINTEDQSAYHDWARTSGPAMGESVNASLVGICKPITGAYHDDDLYAYMFTDTLANALAALPGNDVMKAEVAKLEVSRKVRAREVLSLVKTQSAITLKVGQTDAIWNTIAHVPNIDAYVKAVTAMEKAFHKNGFKDVGIQIFVGHSGGVSGMVMSGVIAKTPHRLGEAFDSLGESWAKGPYKAVVAKRKIVRGLSAMCETVYVK